MQLRDLQSGFKQALLSKDHNDFASQAIAGGEITATARLQVHRNNVIITLTEALKATYPAIDRLVGCEFFEALAAEFIRNHPPTRGTLIAYGGEFGAFLDGFEPAQQLPYLADMARLEWAWNEAFHSADAAPISGAILSDFTPEQIPNLHFNLLPSARLISSSYPIDKLWELTQATDEPDDAIEIEPGEAHILVYRPEMDVTVLFLKPPAFHFLVALNENKTLTGAYEAAAEIDPQFDLQSTLSDLMSGGLFASVRSVE